MPTQACCPAIFTNARLRLKKTLLATERNRPDVIRRRISWNRVLSIDPKRLIFIDETCLKTNMTRLHGWAPIGERLNDNVPYGHWNTMTFIAALRHDGIEAPCLLDQPLNGPGFLVYVESFLMPTLKEGDIVILDNLSTHKNRKARDMIRQKGAKIWFLPPYSPDLNPIEQFFAKLKAFLRKAQGRSITEINEMIKKILRDRSQTECSNYVKNSGYDPTS